MENNKKEFEKTRDALSSIAVELQRFYDTQIKTSSEKSINYECGKVLTEIITCKSKLKQKRLCISKLRKKLSMACLVAKTVIKSKENKSECLSFNDLEAARTNLLSHNNEDNLRNRLEALSIFIKLGYNELKKIRDDCEEDPNILVQLNKLIFSCGQYYADYCNENENCRKLLRNNRFLLSKISILERNLQAATENIKVLQNRNNYKFETQHNSTIRDIISNLICPSNSPVIEIDQNRLVNDGESGDFSTSTSKSDDVLKHTFYIKQLLNDQDILLEELKCITQELA